MLIQEGLSKLKIIKKRMHDLLIDIRKYSAWNDKIKIPIGIIGGNQEYSVKHAEKQMESKIQSYMDLQKEYLKIKTAIDLTNLNTAIEVAGEKMTLHSAILYKREIGYMIDNLINSYDYSISDALKSVENYNNNKEITDKANVLYLFPIKEIDKSRDFLNNFLEEIDSQMQIANSTTELIFE